MTHLFNSVIRIFSHLSALLRLVLNPYHAIDCAWLLIDDCKHLLGSMLSLPLPGRERVCFLHRKYQQPSSPTLKLKLGHLPTPENSSPEDALTPNHQDSWGQRGCRRLWETQTILGSLSKVRGMWGSSHSVHLGGQPAVWKHSGTNNTHRCE